MAEDVETGLYEMEDEITRKQLELNELQTKAKAKRDATPVAILIRDANGKRQLHTVRAATAEVLLNKEEELLTARAEIEEEAEEEAEEAKSGNKIVRLIKWIPRTLFMSKKRGE